MEFVFGVRSVGEEGSVGMGEFLSDVEIADGFAVGELGEVVVDGVDDGHEGHVVVSRKDGCENDCGVGCFGLHGVDDGFDALGDVVGVGIGGDVIGAC